VPTLRRWLAAYRQGGLAALQPQPRQDRGHGRALSDAERDLLCQIRRENPHASATLILHTLVADGRIAKNAVSPVTVRRLFRARGLNRQTLDSAHPTQRLRWQAERPNALWHADVCHGAPLRLPDGRTLPVRIHAFLDDSTRYIVAIEAYPSEQEIDMLQLLVRALRRYGPPQTLYLDNGSTYRGEALRLACARLGITLLHAKPYDAPARGKIERFWRTLRGGCLDHMGEMSSLHEVNVRLYAFVDQHYHRAPHASLMGRAPDDVWRARAAERPADALDDDAIQKALTVRHRRRVRKDSTLS
jgi:putative transposase